MTTDISFTTEDFSPIINTHLSSQYFEGALNKTKSGEDLLRILFQYIRFNSTFAGSVLALAGAISQKPELFLDPKETNEFTPYRYDEILADRSAEVARYVFLAAVDEFGDRNIAGNATHRSLAQSLMRDVIQYFNLRPTSLSAILTTSPATFEAMNDVEIGYTKQSLLERMGFHAGSEALAAYEFDLLDKFLNREYPELVRLLNESGSYTWIKIHKTVEIDHFNAAIAGINSALDYWFDRSKPHDYLKKIVLGGFLQFCSVQAKFMKSL
jgi:hypothetical protein